MPDTFDPDAWPQSSGNKKPNQQPSSTPDNDDDDDWLFDTGASTTPAPGAQNNVPPQDDDDDWLFEPTTGSGGSQPQPASAQPANGNGNAQPADEEDDIFGFFDNEPAGGSNGSGKSQSSPQKSSGFGTFGDDDENDDYDYAQVGADGNEDYDEVGDEFDFDDEFDREPKQQSSNKGKIMALVAVVVAIVAIGFLVNKFLLTDGNPATDGGGDSAQTPSPDGTGSSSSPSGSSDQSNGATTGTVDNAPDDVVDAANKALTAWGKFAINGDLDEVKPYFVNNGNQYERFKAEADTIKAQTAGGPAMVFTLQRVQDVKVNDNVWLLKGIVTSVQEGKKPQQYPWELRMIRKNSKDKWRLFSVRQYQ